MRKSKIFTVLVLSLFLLTAIANLAWADTFKVEPEEGKVTMAAGSIGGSWFVMSAALFDLFAKNIDGLQYSIVPGGGVSNPMTLRNKEADFALVYTTNVYSAYNGEEPYGKPIKEIRGIAKLGMADVVHNFVRAKTGIRSFKEFAEKKPSLKVDTGTKGLAGELAVKRMLELHGVSYENIKSWGGSVIHSSYTEATERLKDGHIDAFMNNDLIGKPLWKELVQSVKINILAQDEEVVKQMVENYGYSRAVIPAGTYKGQEEDILTTSQEPVLIAHKDTSENLVYMMTKLMFEHKKRLVSAYSPFVNLNIKKAIPQNCPLHPGAEKYYKEVGLLN